MNVDDIRRNRAIHIVEEDWGTLGSFTLCSEAASGTMIFRQLLLMHSELVNAAVTPRRRTLGVAEKKTVCVGESKVCLALSHCVLKRSFPLIFSKILDLRRALARGMWQPARLQETAFFLTHDMRESRKGSDSEVSKVNAFRQ